MASKKQGAALASLLKDLEEVATPVETPEQLKAAKMAKVDTDGKMLMCEFTLGKRPGHPDPLCITINDEVRWVKRGAKVRVPWYLVEHMLHNIERKFRQEKDGQGNNIVVHDDMTSEPFQYRPINPAIDPVTGQVFEIQGPNEVKDVQQTY